MMPAFAFAETEQPENQSGMTGQAADDRAEVITDVDIDGEPQPSEDISVDDPAPEENTVDAAADADEEDAADAGTDDEEIPVLESVITESDLPDSDVLLQNYLDTQISEETGTSLKTSGQSDGGVVRKKVKLATRRSTLSAADQKAYDLIKPYIVKIAAGEMSTAKFYVAEADGTNYAKVISAMMTDMPYEFYWHDKVEGYLHGTVSGNRHIFYFAVSKDYWNRSVINSMYGLVYGLDTKMVKRAKTTVDTVSGIINEYADADDINRLYGYRNRICEYATYDYDAVIISEMSSEPFYGDPWQLIYVFDGDDSTNVVCEGYSKAFQYLCDRTDFSDSEIECRTVSGDLYNGSSKLGGHMWNIIHMGNGGNYMADLTNCDEGTYAIESYFLKGYSSGNVSAGYRFLTLKYVYDEDTEDLFSEEELTLSDTDFDTGEPEIRHYPAKAATCTSGGCNEHWLRLGYCYSEENCSEQSRIKYSEAFTKALGHNWSEWTITKKPTCTASGTKVRTCERCNQTESETVAALGHKWSAWKCIKAATLKSTGTEERTCNVCGVREQRVIPKLRPDLCVRSLWASQHDVGRVKFKWTQINDVTVTDWNLKYRMRRIGGNNSWSGWTYETYSSETFEAWIDIPVNYVIEIHAQADGDKTWSNGIITTPAGGRYQAMKTTYVLNTATNKHIGTELTLKEGQTIRVRPDYEYPVRDYNKRPRLYPNHMLYDVADKSILSITKPDGSKYTGGMIDGTATIKAVKKGKTRIIFRSPNGRTQVTNITVK